MTTGETTAKPRANHHGDPCPDWCATRHHDDPYAACIHLSEPIGYRRAPWEPGVILILDGHPYNGVRLPMEVKAYAGAGFIYLQKEEDVNGLANLIEALAGMEPSAVRAFADEVRQAGRML